MATQREWLVLHRCFTEKVRACCFVLLSAPLALWGQVPLEQMTPPYRAAVESVLHKPDFTFNTRTKPVPVRFETMEKLFDHPRVAAAMWRHCQFVPAFYAVEETNRQLTIEDGIGLKGTMTLVYRKHGQRVYLVDGRVATGRMGNPMPVGARMVIFYRYWEGAAGFESQLQTWTTLDSALLSIISRPFKSYIRRRQEEFVSYINENIARGGQFAQINPHEFWDPILREGDPIAVRQFGQIFGQPKNGRK